MTQLCTQRRGKKEVPLYEVLSTWQLDGGLISVQRNCKILYAVFIHHIKTMDKALIPGCTTDLSRIIIQIQVIKAGGKMKVTGFHYSGRESLRLSDII